jgi:hypothetical protein
MITQITQEYLRSRFDYQNGQLICKIKNKPVGSINGRGYILYNINKKSYRLHRLIFLYHYGYLPELVDHKDRNKLNNCIENLREATVSQNNHNRAGLGSNTGCKGIHWSNSRQKYKVAITHNKVYYYLGLYTDLQEAVRVHKEKYIELHGSFEINL